MKFPRFRNKEIEAIRSDIDSVKSQLNELSLCLPERERKILKAIEDNSKSDRLTLDLIAKQKEAIDKLEELNHEKNTVLTGMGKWVVLLVLGILSLSVRYEFEYVPGRGTVIKPDADAGLILPSLYAFAIIAIATGQDEKIGIMLETVGRKLGG